MLRRNAAAGLGIAPLLEHGSTDLDLGNYRVGRFIPIPGGGSTGPPAPG